MRITYLRSSSYGCHEMCEMKYMGEYVLGWTGVSNKAAEKGTIVHKVMEVLGRVRECQQKGNKTFGDDIMGRVNIFTYDIDRIIEKAYAYYIDGSVHDWKDADYREVTRWVNKALTFNDGAFDPRTKDIVAVEQKFDLEVHQPWAMYSYKDADTGQDIDGLLGLKGTIDQLTRINPTVLEITDWKTGQCRNWATGEKYTHETLRENFQLRLYHYVIHELYPEIEQVVVTIYYIRDGGPFTFCYTNADLDITMNMVQKKFEKIRDSVVPSLTKSWKCKKFCGLGMTTFEGTDVQPLTEKRYGERTNYGEVMTKCEQIKFVAERRSPETVVKHMSSPGHDVSHYREPGTKD